MSVATATPVPSAPRMSVWTTFWALAGGGLVGLIATALMADGVRAALRLDGLASGVMWDPFPPLDAWTRAADLGTLAAALLVCGLCVRRISRTDEMELRLWPSVAAVAAVAALVASTHSWWSLAAILPLAVALRYAAQPPAPRRSWARRVAVVGAAGAAYAVVLTPATLALQQHPLFASPTTGCGVEFLGRRSQVVEICLVVENVAFTNTATVLGIDSGRLPRGLPWTLTARPATIAAGRQRTIDVRVHHVSCRAGTRIVVRSVPLRVRVGGQLETASIPVGEFVVARCPSG